MCENACAPGSEARLLSQWVSNLNTKSERQMEVHVRSDLRQGSSYEDDIGEVTAVTSMMDEFACCPALTLQVMSGSTGRCAQDG